MSKGNDDAEEKKPCKTIGHSDHWLAADLVEQVSQHHGTKEAANREGQQVHWKIVVAYMEELFHHQRVSEKDSVEEKGLAHHQGERQEGWLTIVAHHVTKNFFERRVVANLNLQFLSFELGQAPRVAFRCFILDIADDSIGLFFIASKHQPARALRNIQAEHQDRSAQSATHSKRVTPGRRGGNRVTVQKQHRGHRAYRRAHPKGSIDDQIYGAPHLSRNELIDCRIDRRILSADTQTREETKDGEAKKVPGKRTRDGSQ